MKVTTNINSQKNPYNPQQGQARLTQAAPAQYKNNAAQQNYQDVYRAQGQQAAVDLGRANTMAAADYRSRANQAQNQAVLGGLTMLGQQQQNAHQRSQGQQDMVYGWLDQMMGAGGLLGGLL